jgi:queuine tRNA-ribosyltransferase
LIARHNIHFYHQLMKEIRESILEDRFLAFYEKMRVELVRSDEENPSTPYIPAKQKRSEKRLKLGDYEVHTHERGFSSIRQISSGEIMHSVNPPEEEARRLYLEPSRISDRLQTREELVIWDVGLGAASNAMAVIDAHRILDPSKKIRIESFEIDLDPLKLALKNNHLFKHLRSPAPNSLVKNGIWASPEGGTHWRLFHGDFLETMEKALRPDIVFFDPFSPKVDAPLWSAACFKRIFSALRDQDSILMTYSVSTLVRALLLSEGFFVGSGAPSGPKAETTVAFSARPSLNSGARLLGPEWLARWERSSARHPENLSASEVLLFEERIRNHPQFTGEPLLRPR